MQPGAGSRPLPVDCSLGNIQGLGGLLDSQAGEVAQVDHLGHVGVTGLQAFESLIECQQGLAARGQGAIGRYEIDSLAPAAPAKPLPHSQR